MLIWRVSGHENLTGQGGEEASARWHRKPQRIVYCGESPRGALLEVLVHAELDLKDLPASYKLLRVAVPDDIHAPGLLPPPTVSADPEAWRDDMAWSQQQGDEWLHSRRSALLRVPCVIMPQTWNVLINSQHPDATRVLIEAKFVAKWDRRLFTFRSASLPLAERCGTTTVMPAISYE